MDDNQKFKIALAVAILLLVGLIVYMIMVMNKAKKLEAFLISKGLTVAEFDSFVSPTEPPATQQRVRRPVSVLSPITV